MAKSSRTLRQTEIAKAWEENKQGTVQAATGFGKTRIALNILDHYGYSAKVVVPTLYLQDQWRKKLKDWRIGNVEVLVINTAVKERRKTDLLILDEVHRYGSEVFGNIFQTMEYDKLLGLTATLPKEDEKYAYIRDHAPVISKVPLKECLEEGWVSPFVVYNLPVDLSFAEERQYERLNNEYHKHFSAFGHNFNIAMKALKDKNFRRKYARQRKWDEQRVGMHAAQWIRNVNKRKTMLYNLTTKLKVGKNLIKKFPSAKIISFSQTKEFAERLCEYTGEDARPYHSGMTEKEREIAMREFHNGGFRCLSTAKALDQGANLPDLNMAIILAATSKPLQSIQRMGRVLRKRKDKRAVIVEVYARDTQDEKWLQKRQKKTPRETIHYINSVDDVTIEPS